MGVLSEDEIIRDWSLSHSDKIFISKFNKNYRLWLYLQLCALKLFGQLLENPNTLNIQIIGYACKALDLPITATVKIPGRDATRTEHKKQIFEHLNFQRFEESIDQFRDWLDFKTKTGVMVYEQIQQSAEDFLVQNKIALPTAYNLKREINSFCHQSQEALFRQIYSQLPPSFIASVDEILSTPNNGAASWFQKFKEYPGSATISRLQHYLARYHKLSAIDFKGIRLPEISLELLKYLYQLGKYYDVWKIKRFKPEKRYSIMLIFLIESKKVIIDYIIQMHDQYITNICRECKNIHEDRLKQYKRRNEKALDAIECFMDYTLGLPDFKTIRLDSVYEQTISKGSLLVARNDMRQYKIESKYGYATLLQNRYASMRRYFMDFVQLPFMGEVGNQDLLDAITLIQKLDNRKLKNFPRDAPTSFIDHTIITAIHNQDGSIKRNLWEIEVAIAIKDSFRSGDIFIENSNKHVSFWNLVYAEEQWEQEAPKAYRELGIEKDPKQFSSSLVNHSNTSTKQAERQFEKDDFAEIRDEKLVLRKKDKLDEPEDVKRLQALINSYLPKIKIEKLLIEVDQMTGFTKHFVPIYSQKRQFDNFYKSLLSSVMAQAMNIGFATMQNCTPGITAEMMRHVNDSCIREETIKKSNAELVNRHTQLSLSQVHGDGTLSSSDGQRFIITASSLLSSFYPRYCGYYDKIIGIYTHVSDQYAVYNTNAISCSPRESLYVIDGFLDNNTILSIKEHTTDTEGYTEQIFALCFLLGIRFMPRIKDLKSQQLYRVDKNVSYGVFDPLLTKTVSLYLIEEQLDQLVRLVASMKNKLCPAHEIIRRLSKGSPSDQISKAFTHLGRILKTKYILQYITDPQLRDRVYWQLNKGEHRHGLARWIFFANQGKFRVGDYEEIMNKASCLSLASNAVLYWNTVKISEIVDQLRKNGESISNETLSHISLLPYKHVIPMGTYFTDVSTTFV